MNAPLIEDAEHLANDMLYVANIVANTTTMSFDEATTLADEVGNRYSALGGIVSRRLFDGMDDDDEETVKLPLKKRRIKKGY